MQINKSLIFCLLFSFSFIKVNAQKVALNFDGMNDYVESSFSGVSGSGARTIEAWIKTTGNFDPNNGGKQGVICDYGSATTGGRFTFNILFNNRLRIEVQGSGLMGKTAVNDGNWHHVAVSYNPSASSNPYRLYVDGALDTAGDITTAINTGSTVPFRVGMRVDNINLFTGDIDEVRFYNTALTDSAIKSTYKRELCKYPSNLKVYFKFNEGTAAGSNSSKTTAIDYSLSAKNGTLYNFALSGSSSNWSSGPSLIGGNTSSTMNVFDCNSYTTPLGNKLFLPGTYQETIPNVWGCDSLITIKLNIGKVSKTVTIKQCDSFTSNSGVKYYKSGVYQEKLKTYRGCDSVITYNITINYRRDTLLKVFRCDSFSTLKGRKYFKSGLYHDTLKTKSGCDSLIHYKLSIFHPITTYDTLEVCDTAWYNGKPFTNSQLIKTVGLTWGGCDSTHFLNIIIHKRSKKTIKLSGCQSVTTNSGKTYTVSGTYKEVLSSQFGCDSLIEYNVKVYSPVIQYDTMYGCKFFTLRNVTYSKSQDVVWKGVSFGQCDSVVNTYIKIIEPQPIISGNNDTLYCIGNFNTYQWLNCNDTLPISGAQLQWYKPMKDGFYAVLIDLDGCKDTSDCFELKGLFNNSLMKINSSILPNPTTGKISVSIQDYSNKREFTLTIFNELGQNVYSKVIHSARFDIDLSFLGGKGIYFLKIVDPSSKESFSKTILLE